MILSSRYIEIFKSSMQELRTASIGSRGGRGMGMGMGRPGPYDRSDRFMGGGGGMGGGMGYGRGRGRGNLKGTTTSNCVCKKLSRNFLNLDAHLFAIYAGSVVYYPC